MKVHTTIYLEKFNPITEEVIGEMEVEICGVFTPADKGSCDLYGVSIEPDYEESIEFYSATCNGQEIELDEVDEKRALNALWEEIT
jgi:hypothetical protein